MNKSMILKDSDGSTTTLSKDGRYFYESRDYKTSGKIKVVGEQVYMSDNYFSNDDLWAPINGEESEKIKKFLRGQ